MNTIRYFITIIIILSSFVLDAQKKDSRYIQGIVKEGNKEYLKGDFELAEKNYSRAIEKKADSEIALYNLANTYYKQEKYDEATKRYQENKDLDSKFNLAKIYLNDEKYKEAIEEYKTILKANPSDYQVKENLVYALSKLKEQENKDKNQDKDQQDQDKENQDKNQQDQDKENQDKDQQDQDKQNQDKNQQDQDKENQDKNQQDQDKQNQDKDQQDQSNSGKESQKIKISKQEAEQLLRAIEGDEKRTQDKVNKLKAKDNERNQPEKNW